MPRQTASLANRKAALWTLLKWEGVLVNARLRVLFGLQHVQASRQIAELKKSLPDLQFNTSSRIWSLNEWHLREIEGLGGTIDDYISLAGRKGEVDEWLVDARTGFFNPHAKHIRLIHKAIRDGQGLLLRHPPTKSIDAAERIVFPHSVVRLSQRWMIRAWSLEEHRFRFFDLSKARPDRVTEQTTEFAKDRDVAWNTEVELGLTSHEGLDQDGVASVRYEYFHGTGGVRLKVRAALITHTLKLFDAAFDPKTQIPPTFLTQVSETTKGPVGEWISAEGVWPY